MIEIVKANVSNANLIAQLGQQTFYESHGHSASKTDIDSFVLKYYNVNTLAEEFANPKVNYHIIKYNNTPVGFSKVELNSPNQNIPETNVAKLARLYLLEDYHGKNLGASLFDFIIKYSKEVGKTGIWLHVWVENKKAIKFYEKSGFNIVGKYDYEISKTHTNPNHVMYLEY
jgi:ribosomal protein S18 acetylase RimI-like enzyme